MTTTVLSALRGLWIGLLLICSVCTASAQIAPETLAEWQAQINRAEGIADNPEARAEELDAVRATLAEQRSAALQAEEAAIAAVAETRALLDALGPAPAEGEVEADEVAARRAELNAALQAEQVVLLEAQTARTETAAILDRVDSLLRDQFSRRLIELGPTPVNPALWPGAVTAGFAYLDTLRAEVERTLTVTYLRNRLIRHLPAGGLLIAGGLFLLLGIRNRLVYWVEGFVKEGSEGRSVSWGGALLNLARLVVPAIGAVCLISGLQTLSLFGASGQALIDGLPEAAAILILSYWIGHSVFAPAISRFRVIPLDDGPARSGARVTLILGLLLGFHRLLEVILEEQQATDQVSAVLTFPIILLAALALWRLAALVQPAFAKRDHGDEEEDRPEPFGLNMLRGIRRISVLIAVLSPFLAAVGYAALTEFLLLSWIESLGLLGGAIVVFQTFLKILAGIFAAERDPTDTRDPYGLLPVFAGLLIVCVALPILALIWGAGRSDLLAVWVWLRDGVSIGGNRVSLTDALTLLVVFAVGYSLTRFLQSVLRRTVMPRTSLDVGGQNAVVTGLGYVGIIVSAIVAITATGLDLSNLAIVAGALSVGVGFGLQTVVSNFVSGIILLIERPIKEGDWIEVAGNMGTVRRISVRSTRIETFDRSHVIVPNQELIAGTVVNYTHGSLTGRIIVRVGVAYGSDVRKVEEILKDVAISSPLVIRRPPPSVLFSGFGADSLDFEIRAILRDVNYSLSVKSDMHFEIYKRFAEEGIEIPFAQRDIHLRKAGDLADALRSVPKEGT